MPRVAVFAALLVLAAYIAYVLVAAYRFDGWNRR